MEQRLIRTEVLGTALELEAHDGLFSPRHIDRGTLAMLSVVPPEPGMRVMDLGCGYGVVGIAAARRCGAENVWMSDADPSAAEAARRNAARNGVPGVHIACGDGFDAVDAAGFDLILVNPPYQSDFAVAKRFIEKGFNRLKLGGRMAVVVKRGTWYRNKMRAVFGGVRDLEVDGYHVLVSERRSESSPRFLKNGRRPLKKT